MRDTFIQLLLKFAADLKSLVDGVRPGAWNDVPMTATPRGAATVIVDLALAQGWARKLGAALAQLAPASTDVAKLVQVLPAPLVPTSQDPFKEVLLESDRPFCDRTALRDVLRLLCSPGGSTLLLLDGPPSSGKTHSFYLAQHSATQRGFRAHRFEVKRYPKPDQLAGEIIARLGMKIELEPKGSESAERWAEKLATQITRPIEEMGIPRIFFFDHFPEPLPEGTGSLVNRLVEYADQELRMLLRILLIRFPGEVPSALADVAEYDSAAPFTPTHMLEMIRQVAQARGWSVSDQAIQAEITQFLQTGPPRTLSDRARLLRTIIRRLGTTTPLTPHPAQASPP